MLDERDRSTADSTDCDDRHGHGTRCTRAILGLVTDVRVTPIRVFDRTLETSPLALYAALDWAAAQRFDVLNLSLSTRRPDMRDALYRFTLRLRQQETVVVASADNGTSDGYPAVFDTVIGVAVERNTKPASPMDVMIPAAAVARYAGGRPAAASNSLAAACVSGLVARIIGEHGRLGLDDVRTLLAQRIRQDGLVASVPAAQSGASV